MPADLAPHLRGETSARRSAQALCPQPCRPHPCRRRRVFRQCGSARWFGRSSGDVWLSVLFILRMRHSRVNERRPWRGCFASLPDGRQPLPYRIMEGLLVTRPRSKSWKAVNRYHSSGLLVRRGISRRNRRPEHCAVFLKWSAANRFRRQTGFETSAVALFQAQGVRRVHVRGAASRYESGDKGPSGEDQRGGRDGRGICSSDAEQLGLHELAEGGDARERDGYASGNHNDGVAQNKADGGGARGAKREADADFARAPGDHERHHAVETDEREQESENAEAAGESSKHALGVEGAADLLFDRVKTKNKQLGIDITDDVANRLKGLLGRATELDVKRGSEVLVLV